ncbi:MAG: hypothetical protein ACK5MS_11135, partial [Planctomyces sp.]
MLQGCVGVHWVVAGVILQFVAGCGGSGVGGGGEANVASGGAGTGPTADSVAADSVESGKPAYPIVRYVAVPQLSRDLAIFDSVFWEPDDTLSLRQKIAADPQLRGAAVLEVGTGSGLVSLCCLQAGAGRVV